MVLLELCLTISGLIVCYDTYMINKLKIDIKDLDNKYKSINDKNLKMIQQIRNDNDLQHEENIIQAHQNKLQHEENMIIKKLIKLDTK